MKRGYEVKDDVIVMNRSITKLDVFVRDFIDVLKKHTDYLIVSGFVSISAGRTRGTEDVDVLVVLKDNDTFVRFFDEIKKSGFWCYQGDAEQDVYPYIENMQNIRFARINEIFPNIEMIPISTKNKAKFFEFTRPQKMRIADFEFNIPPIEFEILYKELVLGGKKDIDDARHLRVFFSDIIKDEKFKEYRQIISSELL